MSTRKAQPRQVRRGEAGRRGETVRSDLFAAVELRSSGGLELKLTSKVEPYYGDTIRKQVHQVLDGLGVSNAHVEIDDRGALPFVIAARLEAAARAAGVEPSSDAALVTTPLPPPSPRERLRRSRLYLPGGEPKYLVNAGLYGPDAVILDLEDSVHTDEKTAARLLVRNALCVVDFGAAERMVRINQLPLGLEDLDTVLPAAPDLILIPKVETAEEVIEVSLAIDRRVGDGGRPVWLMPILETARGIEHAYEVARASKRVAALTIGLEDYAADLGVPRSADGEESLWARRRLVNAAKAAGVQAIDSVYGQVDDLEGLRDWAAGSKGLGFEGMGCLHPRQIPVIHTGFDPGPQEIERALRIVTAFEQAQATGRGVVSLGSKMIDPPVVEQARRLVARARKAGVLDAESEQR